MAIKIRETVPDKNTVILVEVEVLRHRDCPGPVLVDLPTNRHVFQTV
jgi:hypothetical protein